MMCILLLLLLCYGRQIARCKKCVCVCVWGGVSRVSVTRRKKKEIKKSRLNDLIVCKNKYKKKKY